jgi:hypothetical protein
LSKHLEGYVIPYVGSHVFSEVSCMGLQGSLFIGFTVWISAYVFISVNDVYVVDVLSKMF